MAAVRRGAWVGLRYVTTLFFLGVVVQFFLVGVGLFAMKDGATIDNASSFDSHRGLGLILRRTVAPLMSFSYCSRGRRASCWGPGSFSRFLRSCRPSCRGRLITTGGSACSTR